MKKWMSRKLLAALVGTILVPLLQQWGVPQETINWVVTMLMTYIGGQAVVDAAMANKGTKTE
jgi:spore maturation protein SpmB